METNLPQKQGKSSPGGYTHSSESVGGPFNIIWGKKKILKLNPLEIMPSFFLKAAVEVFTNQIVYQMKKS